jgi:hypothetical protein
MMPKRERGKRERELCVAIVNMPNICDSSSREVCKFLHSTVKCVFVMNTWFGRSYGYSAPFQGNGQSTLHTPPFYTCSHKEHH